MNWLSALSTIVTFVFAAAVFNRYRHKKGNHLLFWGIGLVFYGLGTLTEVILSVSYSTLALKVWYLSGAILTAAWLGQGTVFLLLRKKNWAKVTNKPLKLRNSVRKLRKRNYRKNQRKWPAVN